MHVLGMKFMWQPPTNNIHMIKTFTNGEMLSIWMHSFLGYADDKWLYNFSPSRPISTFLAFHAIKPMHLSKCTTTNVKWRIITLTNCCKLLSLKYSIGFVIWVHLALQIYVLNWDGISSYNTKSIPIKTKNAIAH